MSRSYHITRKAAVILARNGEPEGLAAFAEKQTVKDSTKKYRADYPEACPSAKDTKLKNSFTVGVVKRVLAEGKTKNEEA